MQRVVIDQRLQVFYENAPWPLLYDRLDFYDVINRIVWQVRCGERIYLEEAKLR